MISLIEFIHFINRTRDRKNGFNIYIKGGAPLYILIMKTVCNLNITSLTKVFERVKVKCIYPVDNDLFIELTGIETIHNQVTNEWEFNYTCL